MKAVSFIRCQLVAIAVLFPMFSHAGTPLFQWGDWVAPKSADALKNPFQGDEAAAAAGQQLFGAICFVCHGDKGKGDGINAAALARPPADLTSRRVQRQSDGALFWKITEGNPPMLRFKETLSEEQRWQLVSYVRKLPKLYPPAEAVAAKSTGASSTASKKKPGAKSTTAVKSEPAVESTPVVAAVNPFESVTDGQQLFKSICSACHTIGQGKMVGPDLRGVNSRHDEAWLYKWVRSSQALVKAGDAEAVKLFEENNRVVMTSHRYLSDDQIGSILRFIKNKSADLMASRQAVNHETPRARPALVHNVPVYQKWMEYFLYAAFAFVLFSLFMVMSILNRMTQ
ncbi:MAG: c-type cytochrome [Saprospiraceae bacterium]